MKLTVGERLVLLGVLPEKGDFTSIKIVRKLRETLSFSEAENKVLQFRQKDDKIFWEAEGDKPKDVIVGEKAMDIIKEALKKLNDNKDLTDDHYNLYERFMFMEEET